MLPDLEPVPPRVGLRLVRLRARLAARVALPLALEAPRAAVAVPRGTLVLAGDPRLLVRAAAVARRPVRIAHRLALGARPLARVCFLLLGGLLPAAHVAIPPPEQRACVAVLAAPLVGLQIVLERPRLAALETRVPVRKDVRATITLSLIHI